MWEIIYWMSVSITFIESKAKQNKTQESICYQGVIALALNLHLEFLCLGSSSLERTLTSICRMCSLGSGIGEQVHGVLMEAGLGRGEAGQQYNCFEVSVIPKGLQGWDRPSGSSRIEAKGLGLCTPHSAQSFTQTSDRISLVRQLVLVRKFHEKATTVSHHSWLQGLQKASQVLAS